MCFVDFCLNNAIYGLILCNTIETAASASPPTNFLANVKWRYTSSPVRLSVVCNVRAPYSDNWNFRQCFYAIWHLGHLWPGELNTRRVAEYSDFGPIERHISETVQDKS